MGVFAYPHREGARLTLQVLLEMMDGEKDYGIRNYTIVVKEKNFISNMRTVYREGEDQFPRHGHHDAGFRTLIVNRFGPTFHRGTFVRRSPSSTKRFRGFVQRRVSCV